MSIDPVKIPQNVYVEDRIIGPITLKQIMIIMISAGISYAIWAAMKSAGPVSSIQSGLAWTPTVLGVVFAFVKINGLSLLRIILLTLERLDKPATRVWVPRQGIYVNIVTKERKKAPSQQAPVDKKDNDHIQELSRVLDQGPEEEEEGDSIVPTKNSETPPKPVNPKRVQAEKRKKPVDDIAPPNKDDKRTGGGGLLRDISPPPSHA